MGEELSTQPRSALLSLWAVWGLELRLQLGHIGAAAMGWLPGPGLPGPWQLFQPCMSFRVRARCTSSGRPL